MLTQPLVSRAPQSLDALGRWAVWLVALAFAGIALSKYALDVGTFRVGVMDPITAVLLVVGLAGRPWTQIAGPARWAVGALVVAVAVGVLCWVGFLGVQWGVNRWREWLAAVGFLLVAVSYGRLSWQGLRAVLIAAAVIVALFQLCALFVFGWARGAAELAEATGAAAFYFARPIPAGVALLLVVGFALVITGSRRGALRPSAALLLGVSAVLSQHRSVWAALIIALALLLAAGILRVPRDRSALLALGGTGVFLLAAVALPVVSNFSILPGGQAQGDSGAPNSSGQFASTSDHTLLWRFDMWESRLRADRSPSQWAVGSSLGPTPVNAPDSVVMEAGISGHSTPVDLITMVGVVGLLAAGTMFALAARRSRKSDFGLFVCLWSLLAYGGFYMWPPWAWLLIGVGVVSARLAPNPPGGNESQTAHGASATPMSRDVEGFVQDSGRSGEAAGQPALPGL